jgi:hypothetical protein
VLVLAFQDSETVCCTGGEVISRATVTDFVVPPPVRVTCPVHGPAFNPVIEGLTCRVEGAVPEAPANTNQGWSLTPVKVSFPAPVFVMLTLAGARVDVPACPLKLKLVGLTASTGTSGMMVTVEEAFLLGSTWLDAVTMTEVCEATDGAVKTRRINRSRRR